MTRSRRTCSHRPGPARRAFSLIEVLMAIFILGIGAISIAALFPAGIAQQRQSADDVMGPIVANNALEMLRTRLSQNDFGSFEDFGGVLAPRPTVEGDWSWLRPSYIFEAGLENGAIDVFSFDYINGSSSNRSAEFFGGYQGSSPALYGVPYNRAKYPDVTNTALRHLITRGERYYPQHSERPQYVWDCMFRRFQGRILVAIFVYRATLPGGEQAAYAVAPETSDVRLSPLPILPPPLGDPGNEAGAWDPFGADGMSGTADDAFLEGTECDQYLPFDRDKAWQEAGQWIVDQNNNVHRVLAAYCDDEDANDPRVIELVRPVPAMPDIGPYYMLDATNGNLSRGEENVVTDIWYLPLTDDNDVRITPVYVTVKEL